MTNFPVVAIVGRPNVGKSTLFNRLMGLRSAIVHDMPGVTRDRHYGTARIMEWPISLIDTGGFAPGEEEGMLPLMRDQARIAMDEADVIIFLTNARDGVTPADEEIAAVLRRTDKPVLLAANKCDSDAVEIESMSMYSLGFDTVYPIAAEHNRGILDLCEALIDALCDTGKLVKEEAVDPQVQEDDDEIEDGGVPVRGGTVSRLRVCFVGRPNVGKSTLVNKILGKERVIAADQPGTTRDAIDIDFEWHGEPFTLVDTAGLRRKRAVDHPVEQYSISQAVRAIERCHIAVLVLDSTQPLSDQDNKIAALIQDRGRACVVAVNKWDAIEKETSTMSGYDLGLLNEMPFVEHVPRAYISAKNGQRVDKLMETVRAVYDAFNCRVPTAAFNKWLTALQERNQPPTYHGKALKMYYGNQIAVRPPQFVVQVNTMGAISPAYERFLIGKMREEWGFEGTPVRLKLKKKETVRKFRAPGWQEAMHPEGEAKASEKVSDWDVFTVGEDEDMADDEG